MPASHTDGSGTLSLFTSGCKHGGLGDAVGHAAQQVGRVSVGGLDGEVTGMLPAHASQTWDQG